MAATETTTKAKPTEPRIKLLHKLFTLQTIMDGFEWKKDGLNTMQKYRYISDAQYKDNFKKARAQAGLIWKMDEVDHTFLGAISEKMHLITAKYCGRLTDPETGEYEEYYFGGSGADNGDKALYKAVTGGFKFFVSSNFLVAENMDPENDEVPAAPKFASVEKREELKKTVADEGQSVQELRASIEYGITMLKEIGTDAELIATFEEIAKTQGVSKVDLEAAYGELEKILGGE